MSFAEWTTDSADPYWDERCRARRWNLLAETRIDEQMQAFCEQLGETHANLCTGVADRSTAAREALVEAATATRPVDSRWLGHLKLDAGAMVPRRMHTHATASDLARFGYAAFVDDEAPPPRLPLRRGWKTDAGGSVRVRFIWLTFDADGAEPCNDPGEVVRQLGLADLEATDYIYRMSLTVDPARLFVPTCLDAGLNEAWAPPPAGFDVPWGMTRHLETGEPARPEVLAETVDHAGGGTVAELVCPPGAPARCIGAVSCDFMRNRGDDGR